MDSHPLQSSSPFQRARATSNLPLQSIDARGAIRKRSSERPRDCSISSSQAERLHQLALDPWSQADSSALTSTSGLQWITPESSPQAQPLLSEPSISDASIEALSAWSVPTPPQSDSGVPSFCLDSNEKPAIPASASPADFQLDQAPTSSEMSSLGFLLPSQYGPGMYESEPHSYTMDQNYMPPIRNAQPNSTNAPPTYSNTLSSSPALYQSRTVPEASMRRQSGFSAAADSPMDQNLRRVSTPYDSSSGSQYSMSSGQTIPSISGLTQNPLPSPHIAGTSGSSMSSYGNSMSRSPGLYDSYPQQYNTQTPPSQSYASNQSLGSFPPPFLGGSVNEVMAKPIGSDTSIRVLNQRPKPQCWEHGCNGRQFSTFSNLLRHQREKSGTATKSYCPKCGAEFTRTTARNGHLAHDKCSKQRRPSDDS
ncbi:hypothetical protein D0867_14411 [Hortaea werneckii]|uniref:C2H2-type domain-containing protein n=1 Tax=Hortaea werneckii TaxID=91943 RepID=A0A3M6XQL7_HORWE|nr:hypothetical protein D0867_14411 [Hortaea werneckii]RMY32538.1 hypothetical protein D0866_06536 [Hortaea werneckii]